MKLYNTLTRQLETVSSTNKNGEIGLYACGPTVYDFTHLGHLRKYTMDDVLVRVLRHSGLRVKHVENVTDVGHLTDDGDAGEDKLEKGSRKYNQTVWELAKRFENFFWHSMDLMGNLRPEVICKATEHIEEQLAMVVDLEKKGFAYVIEGDGVYFDTSKLDDYGKLARLNLDKLKEGARIGEVSGKRNLADFALWKFEKEGESRQMVWESPWHPRSFPGWHIECSAMSMKYLGEQFKIHTGGIDHIPVHHTNEIAQAEAATGKKPFVKIWVHHNFLQVDGQKMSKSLGNFFTIDDVVEKGFEPMALRLLFLTSHYRSEMNFTWDNLEGSQKAWDKLKVLVSELRAEVRDQAKDNGKSGVDFQIEKVAQKYLNRFFESLENDLNTSQALAMMWELTKDADLESSDKLLVLEEMLETLGLVIIDQNSTQISAEVQQLLDQRDQARQQKNWEESDRLRDEISKLGYKVEDTAEGQKID